MKKRLKNLRKQQRLWFLTPATASKTVLVLIQKEKLGMKCFIFFPPRQRSSDFWCSSFLKEYGFSWKCNLGDTSRNRMFYCSVMLRINLFLPKKLRPVTLSWSFQNRTTWKCSYGNVWLQQKALSKCSSRWLYVPSRALQAAFTPVGSQGIEAEMSGRFLNMIEMTSVSTQWRSHCCILLPSQGSVDCGGFAPSGKRRGN